MAAASSAPRLMWVTVHGQRRLVLPGLDSASILGCADPEHTLAWHICDRAGRMICARCHGSILRQMTRLYRIGKAGWEEVTA